MTPDAAKPFKGLTFKGLKGVMEIVERYATDTYPAMYVEVVSIAFVGTAPVGGFRGSGVPPRLRLNRGGTPLPRARWLSHGCHFEANPLFETASNNTR